MDVASTSKVWDTANALTISVVLAISGILPFGRTYQQTKQTARRVTVKSSAFGKPLFGVIPCFRILILRRWYHVNCMFGFRGRTVSLSGGYQFEAVSH